MILSPPTQHALRALIYLARHGDGALVHSRAIASSEAIPGAFLAKILHRLCGRGLLRSVMGPGGGYALARPARDISVYDIAAAFDDAQELGRTCLLGFSECSDQDGCALHTRWQRFRQELSQWMTSLTLEEIATQQGKLGSGASPRRRGRTSAVRSQRNAAYRSGRRPARHAAQRPAPARRRHGE